MNYSEMQEGKLENILAEQIIQAAIEVHRTLGGPGLLESIYENALCHELRLRNIQVQAQILIDGLSRIANRL